MPGGIPPRTPPLLVTSRAVTGHSPFLCFLQESFLANERENIFGGSTVKKVEETTNGGLSSTCMHVRA